MAKFINIVKNGVDISGKTFRETEAIVAENLGDLDYNYVSNVILLGQGMPNKFSSLTPVDKKKRLEALTKSDFMIDEIKERVTNRTQIVNTQIRAYEDQMLVLNTKLNTASQQLAAVEAQIKSYTMPDYSTEIAKLDVRLSELEAELININQKIEDVNIKIGIKNADLVSKTNEKASEKQLLLENYTTKYSSLLADKAKLETKVSALTEEINKLASIREFCPTCGQKLPNVNRPDTSKQQQELYSIKQQLTEKQTEITDCNNRKISFDNDISNRYDKIIANLQIDLQKLVQENSSAQSKLTTTQREIASVTETKNKLIYNRDNWQTQYNTLLKNAENFNQLVTGLNEEIENINILLAKQGEHLAVLKKIDTLVKRDFRSHLLKNIIVYLNMRAKDYCNIVFGTDEIEIYSDNTALDITYCGKMFENLSGGEKQRVDLIIQLAIRDMLSKYLNFDTNLIVLDEIFDNLDKLATERILELITTRLSTIESIFIISHHTDELNLPVDSELKIIKTTTGISEVQ